MKNALFLMLGALVLVTAGIVVGWFVASGGHGPAAEVDPAAGAGAPQLSAQALANLGVEVEPVATTDFVQTVRVQATVVDAPLNTRPVSTALGGIVTELHVRPGSRVRPGDPMVTIARAAIGRPELALTGALLPSLSEDVHAAVAAYRNATTQVTIVRKELERVRAFTSTGTSDGLPILPRKTQIDLEYDLARAEQDLANARREIERHGLEGDEVAASDSGKLPVKNEELWRRALASAGFWTEREDRILEVLPEALRRVPWLVGALGELVAAGQSSEELEHAVRDAPALQKRFVDAVCLLLAGESVARVRSLAESGELDQVVILRAPAGPPDWDVEDVAARPGQRVESGAVVATLHDARSMWLRVEPIGEEVASVTRAYEEGTKMTAASLLDGAGPDVDGLVVDRLATRGGQHERGAVAFVVCANTPLSAGADGQSRTWGLREGLQYLLEVPSRRLPGRFVLPAEAVIQMGVERVVLVKDGDAFRSQPVHVEYEDEDVAVLANDGALFPGDPVCVRGAFALGLGLQRSDPGMDPHAGHDH